MGLFTKLLQFMISPEIFLTTPFSVEHLCMIMEMNTPVKNIQLSGGNATLDVAVRRSPHSSTKFPGQFNRAIFRLRI